LTARENDVLSFLIAGRMGPPDRRLSGQTRRLAQKSPGGKSGKERRC